MVLWGLQEWKRFLNDVIHPRSHQNGSRFSPRSARGRLVIEQLEPRIAPAMVALLDPNPGSFDSFGCSLALSAVNALVGADGMTNVGTPGAGSAYLYSISGQLLQTFLDPNHTMNDGFGCSVALSGSNVLVGAYGSSHFEGAAYLYNTSGQLLQNISGSQQHPK